MLEHSQKEHDLPLKRNQVTRIHSTIQGSINSILSRPRLLVRHHKLYLAEKCSYQLNNEEYSFYLKKEIRWFLLDLPLLLLFLVIVWTLKEIKVSNVIRKASVFGGFCSLISLFLSLNNKDILSLNEELFNQINHQRRSKGLSKLEIDSCLCKAATEQSNYLYNKPELSHFHEEESKKYPDDRLRINGCDFNFNAENLIRIYSDKTLSSPEKDAKKMVKLWMGSKSHKTNMLHKKARKTCIVSKRKDNRVLAVQVFTD